MSWNESSIGDEGGREAEEKTGKWTIPVGKYYHREEKTIPDRENIITGVEVCQGGIVPQTTPRAGGGKTGPGTWEVEERRSCVGPAGTLSLWGVLTA